MPEVQPLSQPLSIRGRLLQAAWLAPARLIVAHRHMLRTTTANDVRARYAGSVLGQGWLLLYPLLLLSAYAAVYLYVFEVRIPQFNSTEYVALIFCGLIPFLGVAESVALGLPSVTANSRLIRNTLFPIELVPVKAVLTAQCSQVIGLTLLLAALAFLGLLGPWSVLVVPIWGLQLVFLIGVNWFLSALNVFLRDLQSVVSLLVMLLMMISPIAYTHEMLPDALKPVMRLNPLSYFIAAYRDCLMLGRCPDAASMAGLMVIAFSSFFGGYFVFTRLKPLFGNLV